MQTNSVCKYCDSKSEIRSNDAYLIIWKIAKV